MEIKDKMASVALLLQNMDKQLNTDVLTEIFDFLPFKFKRYLNKELYIMGWKEMIIRRHKQFSAQTIYNYYKFIINNSYKHRCVFILDLIMKKRDFYMPYPRCRCTLRYSYRKISYNYGKIKDFYEIYAEISSTNTYHEKIQFFSNLLYDEKLEFDYLFETKIWPEMKAEMKDGLGSLIKDRYTIERTTEYSIWSSYDNKLDYLNSKCWLK